MSFTLYMQNDDSFTDNSDDINMSTFQTFIIAVGRILSIRIACALCTLQTTYISRAQSNVALKILCTFHFIFGHKCPYLIRPFSSVATISTIRICMQLRVKCAKMCTNRNKILCFVGKSAPAILYTNAYLSCIHVNHLLISLLLCTMSESHFPNYSHQHRCSVIH